MPSQSGLTLPRGRLIFAIDATGEATWGKSCAISRPSPARRAAFVLLGNESTATKWLSSGEQFTQLMNKIDWRTQQVRKILRHGPLQTLKFIGDALEKRLIRLPA
jgi:hypothetical protein